MAGGHARGALTSTHTLQKRQWWVRGGRWKPHF